MSFSKKLHIALLASVFSVSLSWAGVVQAESRIQMQTTPWHTEAIETSSARDVCKLTGGFDNGSSLTFMAWEGKLQAMKWRVSDQMLSVTDPGHVKVMVGFSGNDYYAAEGAIEDAHTVVIALKGADDLINSLYKSPIITFEIEGVKEGFSIAGARSKIKSFVSCEEVSQSPAIKEAAIEEPVLEQDHVSVSPSLEVNPFPPSVKAEDKIDHSDFDRLSAVDGAAIVEDSKADVVTLARISGEEVTFAEPQVAESVSAKVDVAEPSVESKEKVEWRSARFRAPPPPEVDLHPEADVSRVAHVLTGVTEPASPPQQEVSEAMPDSSELKSPDDELLYIKVPKGVFSSGSMGGAREPLTSVAGSVAPAPVVAPQQALSEYKQPGARWFAQSGANLRDVLVAWALDSQVELIWDCGDEFHVPMDGSYNQNFEHAVASLLDQYASRSGAARPVAELFVDQASQKKVLVVKTEDKRVAGF